MPRKVNPVSSAQAAALLSEHASYEFQGKTYRLALTYRLIFAFEDLTGLSFLTDGDKIFYRPSLKALSGLLFILLSAAGCKATHEQVAEYIADPAQTKRAFEAVLAARANSLVKAKPGDPPQPPVM